MTDREKYIRLCAEQSLPLHAQAWWLDCVTLGKEWDVVLIEEEGVVMAAMPYYTVSRYGIHAILMPIHSQYNGLYIDSKAPQDIFTRLVEKIEDLCHKRHIAWLQIQGFFSAPFVEVLRTHRYSVKEKVTYKINSFPEHEEISVLFSENKRRQLRKAQDLELKDIAPAEFYHFHTNCITKQGKLIDYSKQWADSVLPVAIEKGQGRLLCVQNAKGVVLAAMFLAWDDRQAYYLLPTYDLDYKNTGAMARLTSEALKIAKEKCLAFDFEGSMTPSIASSYQQFGGKAETYFNIEKFFNPIVRILIRARKCL